MGAVSKRTYPGHFPRAFGLRFASAPAFKGRGYTRRPVQPFSYFNLPQPQYITAVCFQFHTYFHIPKLHGLFNSKQDWM
jgi:hypothetical protein